MDLTPKELHYFKRELVTEELKKEIDLLVNIPDIAPILDENQDKTDFPFIRYIFHNIIIEFPLLKHTCTEEFWPKIKLFFNEFNKAQLASFYTPRQSESNIQRKLLQHKIEKSLVFAFCASIKTTQGHEESIHIQMSNAKPLKSQPTQSNQHIKVNIVSVREIKERQLLREVSHPEFLIESYLDSKDPVYVARQHDDFRNLRDELKRHFKNMNIPLVPLKLSNQRTSTVGYGEQDRLLLRAWLQQLVGTPAEMTKQQHQIQKSQELHRFLSENPIVFSIEEEKDAALREQADKKRIEEQEQYQQELEKRVFELNDTLEILKKSIIQPGGLIKVFEIIKSTPSIEDLPVSLKTALEWSRINFAFALHRQFISSDLATENLDKLRLTHNLMPYRTISLFLRFSNPMFIVKSVLDLFLAQPFGGKSLLQRLIISNMNEESKTFQKEIQTLEEKINDKSICEKVYNAVRTPLPDDSLFRKYKTKTMEIFAIFNNKDIEPVLSIDQLTKLSEYEENRDSKKLVQRTIQLWELYTKQYEQELLMELVFQGLTGELLKEFISVFYQPLAQVYKAADLSTTITHVSSFITDLVQLVDQIQKEKSDNKFGSIQVFIDLVQRHEQHFYDFVHNVHSQEASTVFDELVQYLDKLFTFVTEGMPGELDLDHCIERAGIKDLDGLKQEIDALCEYRYQQKLYRFERQKKKLMLPEQNEMMDVLDDLNSDESSMSSASSLASGSSLSSGSHLSHKGFKAPELTLIPKILPYFVQDVTQMINKQSS